MNTRVARALSVGLAALAVGVSRFATRARVPDDYDGFGFVLAVRDFDLARLQPHFPGYPVYVALTRAADRLVGDPLVAATLVSAIAAAATAAALWLVARRLAGERAAWLTLGAYGVAWLPWLYGGSPLSDGTATMFAALAAALLALERPALSGLAIAAMLGTRASYWPLALSWLLLLRSMTPQGRRAIAASIAGTLAWLVPFALVVGRDLPSLALVHLRGHFGAWGGSIATRPGMLHRSMILLRSLGYDGFAPFSPMLAIAIGLAIVAGRDVRPSRRGARLVAVALAPYLLWVLLAQNVLAQPRHVLPLVAALAVAVGGAMARRPRVAIAALVACLVASAQLAWRRAHSSPAGAQAAAWVASRYAPREAAVFCAAGARWFRDREPTRAVLDTDALADVPSLMERLDVLPRHVLVCSDVAGDAPRGVRLDGGPTFCRDERIDRATPCLALRELHLGRASAP